MTGKKPIYISEHIHRELKIAAIRADLPLHQFVDNFLERLLTPKTPAPIELPTLSESPRG